MLVYGECECFVMQMLYVCVLCACCGSSQCCVLHVCCSDCVGVCGNVCCVAAVVKNSVVFLALEC